MVKYFRAQRVSMLMLTKARLQTFLDGYIKRFKFQRFERKPISFFAKNNFPIPSNSHSHQSQVIKSHIPLRMAGLRH